MSFQREIIKGQLAELANSGIYLGTSSWKYRGWCDLLYDEAELGGLNLYGYVGNNPINFYDPLGLYNYSAEQTQKFFLQPAFNLATAGPVKGLFNMKNNLEGLAPYDFGNNNHKNDCFNVNGQWLTADQFGNYIAGYMGEAYDEYTSIGYPALAEVYLTGLKYHLLGDTKAVNDPWDKTGFPYIHMGAEGVPPPPPAYQESPSYQYGL